MAEISREAKDAYWAKTRSLTFTILFLWFIFAIVVPFFADSLNSMSFLGFPLGYYMCVQGSLIIFVLLIWFQNWRQDSIDDEYGVGD